jgi:hypothetical protein
MAENFFTRQATIQRASNTFYYGDSWLMLQLISKGHVNLLEALGLSGGGTSFVSFLRSGGC